MLTSVASVQFVGSFSMLADIFSLYYAQQTGQLYEASHLLDTLYDTSSMIYINMIQYVVWIWYGDIYIKEHSEHRFFFYIFALSLILIPITRQEILMRLNMYFVSFSPIFLGLLYSEKKYRRCLPLVFCMIYEFMYYFYGLYLHQLEFPLTFNF